MLAGHRITFRGPYPIKNKNMLAGHVLPTPDIAFFTIVKISTIKKYIKKAIKLLLFFIVLSSTSIKIT